MRRSIPPALYSFLFIALSGAIAATWGSLGTAVFAIALYHRSGASGVQGHPLRTAILHHVRTEPGILASQIAYAENATLNAVLYHVRVLEREGLLRIRRVGHAGLLFPREAPLAAEEARVALHAPIAAALVALSRLHQVLTSSEAAKHLSVSDRSIRAQVANLVRQGLLERIEGPKGIGFRLTAHGLETLAPAPSVTVDRGRTLDPSFLPRHPWVPS